MPRHIRKQDVIDALEIEPFCNDRRCTVYHNLDIMHLVVATEVTSGFSIKVQVDSQNQQMPRLPEDPPEETQGYFDDLALMQQPSTAQTPSQSASGSSAAPTATSMSNFSI